MSLNGFSICESSNAEFLEHVFSLKKNISIVVHEAIPIDDNVNMPTSGSIVRDSIDQPRRSK